jgi:hypothetical protein
MNGDTSTTATTPVPVRGRLAVLADGGAAAAADGLGRRVGGAGTG